MDYYYYYLLLIPRFSHEAQSAYNQIQKQIINTYMYM